MQCQALSFTIVEIIRSMRWGAAMRGAYWASEIGWMCSGGSLPRATAIRVSSIICKSDSICKGSVLR